MQNFKIYLAVTILLFSFMGCITSNEVAFVTKSSLGLDFDTKPATVSIAYDRIEGYIGPRYDNGALPPVIASIKTDGKILNPHIKQIYATGAAATNLAMNDSSYVKAPTDFSGDKKLMFFGTSTTTGIKIGFTTNVPDSFVFGYKRKEFSFIPLGNTKVTSNGTERIIDIYPSVLASIDTGVSTSTPTETSFKTNQFFATGEAAVELSKDRTLKNQIKKETKNAFETYESALSEQQSEALIILRCFTKIKNDQLPDLWADADRHNLFYDSIIYGQLLEKYNQALAETDAEAKLTKIRILRSIYADEIGNIDGSTPTRKHMLQAHGRFVCEQTK